MNKYDDILNLPHHRSKTHPHMSISDRAAQFAPFAALTGYGDAVRETARLTDEKMELDADALADLDETGIEAVEKMIEQREMTIRRMLDILELLVRERNKNEGAIDTRE